MKKFLESSYAQHARPYFNTNASYGREPDTIIFFYLVTPTGRFSKHYATLRFNAEHSVSTEYKLNKIQEYIQKLRNSTFRTEIQHGYTIAEPLLYSGTL